MERRRKKLKILEKIDREYLIDPQSRASWDLGEETFELVDLLVVKFAISHMKPIDRLNPIRVGLATLESWHILYERSPVSNGKYDPDVFFDNFTFKF